MVLAAGLGERMRPLTLSRAKPVLPLLNRPLICWTLERLARAGVKEVVVNLHHRPESVRRVVGDGRSLGLSVRYSREPTLLGTGGGPRRVRRWLGRDPVLLVNGDIFFDFNLGTLLRRHREMKAEVTLALCANPDPGCYSLVLTDARDRVTSIGRGPRKSRAAPALFAGIHVISPGLLERLPPGPSDTVKDLYLPLIAQGRPPSAVWLRGAWYDLGRRESYHAAAMALLRRPWARTIAVHRQAQVHPHASVFRSVLGAGCVVAAGARVRSSVLWEGVSVGAGATIRNCVVADRVAIPAQATIENVVVVRGRPPVELAREQAG